LNRVRLFLPFLGILSSISISFGLPIQLNEIVSINSNQFFDEDGDSPDWIEIYNPTQTTINLDGFGLSDNPNDISKWTFPPLQLDPYQFITIFASEKNRRGLVNQWDAVIDWSDNWYYWVGSSPPIANWEHPGTDISTWETGQSGFGYGDGDDNTVLPQTISVFVRKEFEVLDSSNIAKAIFHLDFDDGYIAYLNGEEISRQNLGAPGSTVAFDEPASGLHEAEIYSGGTPDYVEINLNQTPIIQGQNVLAVEVHNFSANSSDLSCIPFLTLGYTNPLTNTNSPNPILEFPSSNLHTNFKINSNGETIYLSNSSEIILDSIEVGNLQPNTSFGRYLEGDSWYIFNTPTPGFSNSGPHYLGALSPVEISLESGIYSSGQFQVTINTIDENAQIFFTLDGSSPTQNSQIYTSPIIVNSTVVLRVKSFKDNWLPSETRTKTYIFSDEEFDDIPLVFISADPGGFFDVDTGMYSLGSNADQNFPHFGANFWEDWERPIHFEILEVDGSGYSANAGAKIFGGWSRGFPQKSISIFSRNSLGPSNFDYNLFPFSDEDSFESFILRNSGNDWESTMIRDGFITSLAKNLDIDYQLYRPSVVFINGEYWGIHNIREKVSEHFLASKHSLSTNHIDLLELEGINDWNIVHGSNTNYQQLIQYLETQNLTSPDVQHTLEHWIDLDSYFSYQAFQIFIDNRDWPGNNIKFWRNTQPGGKWRWILYDTDFGFGIWDPNSYTFNTLDFALQLDGPGWPNPPWSTFLFRKLIENSSFKDRFINTYCDLLNTVFLPSYLSQVLDSISTSVEHIIPLHKERWYNNGNWPNSAIDWESKILNMDYFAQQRRTWAILHLTNRFNLPGLAQVTINQNSENGGKVKLNSLEISETNWQGYYFPTIPIRVRALPNNGYIFSHWEEFPDSSESMTIHISDPFELTAIFIPSESTNGPVVINEINYNSNDSFESSDWVEIYNMGGIDVDLSNWILKDNNPNNEYNFPNGTILESDGFLIISNDLTLFYSHYPTTISAIGPFDFGLSGGGDEVKIFDQFGTLMDSVLYDDNSPWPIEPDGNGHTLELINPELDNSIAESWSSSTIYGTPGEQNSSFIPLEIQGVSTLPNRIRIYPNFPNPFNPSTTISFDIPSNSVNQSVEINIYNIRGQLIQQLIKKELVQGHHKLKWTPQNLSSGLYILQFKSGDFIKYQKMTFLK